MPDVISEMQALRTAKFAAARRAYGEILARADEPRPGDTEALSGVMETLGLTDGQAAWDVAALRRDRDLPRQYTAAEAAVGEATAAVAAAEKALEDAKAADRERRATGRGGGYDRDVATAGKAVESAKRARAAALSAALKVKNEIGRNRADAPRAFDPLHAVFPRSE